MTVKVGGAVLLVPETVELSAGGNVEAAIAVRLAEVRTYAAREGIVLDWRTLDVLAQASSLNPDEYIVRVRVYGTPTL